MQLPNNNNIIFSTEQNVVIVLLEPGIVLRKDAKLAIENK